MTIQALIDAWITSGAYHDVEPPATEAEIQATEATIGAQLPTSLREIYPLFNGGWIWDLQLFPLDASPDEKLAVTNANELYIGWEWRIPQEIRLFAHTDAEEVFGIWLAETDNPIYNHPIIEVGELFEEGCMGVVGTNLLSFLFGWAAYHLVYDERDKLWKIELGEDKDAPNQLKRIQTALDMLQVPQSLRGEHFDHDMPPFRKWADPQLPDPHGSSYSQEYTVADLKRLFGELR